VIFRDALAVLGLVCCGTVAGVFFAVSVSVVPALAALPPARYLEVHQLLGSGYHPVMPIMATTSVFADATLGLATGGLQRAAYLGALVLLVGVQGVSHLRNEPLNRRVRDMPPGSVPAGWEDPRRPWRSWHLVRTVLAMAALMLNGMASVLP
jgi:uncharacterized membrane protein